MTMQTRTRSARTHAARLICAALFVAGACGAPQEGEPPALPAGRAVSTLWLDASNPRIARATAQQFRATATFSDGVTDDVSSLVQWSQTDVAPATQVATIDSSGRVMGHHAGQAIITATLMGQSVSTTLTVTLVPLVSLAITPTSPTIARGTSQAFTATGTFSDGTTQDLSSVASWSIFDLAPAVDVASIDDGGVALGLNVGQTSIRAEALGQAVITTLTVTAETLVSLAVAPGSATIVKGSRQQFRASGTFSDASVQDVSSLARWSVAATAPATHVASVTSRGLATATGAGNATITASLMGKSSAVTLTVVELTLSSLALSPTSPTIAKGGAKQLTLTGTFTDGTTQDLTNVASFTTTDIAPAMNVASIDGRGLVTGNNLGQATITAAAMGRTITTVVTVTADTALCSPDKWCWRNPLPLGQPLRRTWAADATHIWAVGDNGTILKSDGLTWTRQTSGTTNHLNAIWGTDATHVWAVGDNGTILQGNGSTWTSRTSGSTNRLNGVYGSDNTHVWAVGENGTALAWNGTAWTALSSLGSGVSVYGVWGTGASQIWVVTSYGVQKWTSSGWNSVNSGGGNPSGTLRGIWGQDTSHVWVVGDRSLFMWDGTRWWNQREYSTEVFNGVWGSDINHVWVVGAGGLLLKWTGSIWSTQTSGTTLDLYSVAGSGSTRVWAVGAGGAIIKGDGRSFAPQNTAATTNTLSAIWGSDPGHIWSVGAGGTILRSDGSTWSVQSSPTSQPLNAIWGSDATHAWAVGGSGTVIRWDGSSWQVQPTGVSVALYGVWGSSATEVWAVGAAGTILNGDYDSPIHAYTDPGWRCHDHYPKATPV